VALGNWLSLVLLATMWGSTFIFHKAAVAAIPPLSIVAFRTLATAAILAGVLAVGLAGERRAVPWRRLWRPMLLLGVVNGALPFFLIAWSQQHIEASLGGILNAAVPMFTVLFSHLLIPAERATLLKLTGVLVGFSGVVLVLGPGALAGLGQHLAGQFAMLGACVCYAMSSVVSRRLGPVPVVALAAGQLAVSGLIALPLALAVDRPWQLTPDWRQWGALAAITIYGTALPALIFYRLIQRTAALNVSLVSFLIPIVAVGLGVVVLGERVGASAGAGFLVILAGVALTQGRPPGLRR
jgi:drug/metabolite transporter (DMT)-like permease